MTQTFTPYHSGWSEIHARFSAWAAQLLWQRASTHRVRKRLRCFSARFYRTELFKAWLSTTALRVRVSTWTSIFLSLSVCMSVLLRISCSWTHLMFELAVLNDRANCERRPQALLSQGFKGPATRLLSAVTGGDGNVQRRDNPRRTEPRVGCLFDRLINGNPPRKKPLSA